MKKLYYIYPLIIILHLFCFLSCGVDLPECTPPDNEGVIDVFFSYVPKEKSDRGINPDEVKSFTLFVFDDKGKYVLTKTITDIIFNKEFHITLNLKAGEYSFVVWGNLETPYDIIPSVFIEGVTDISSAILYLQRPQSNFVTTTIPVLVFGNSLAVNIDPNSSHSVTIPLVQNTNSIEVIVNGLSRTNDDYLYTITDSNSKYYFDNTFAPDAEFSYTSTMNFNNKNQLVASINTLRLAQNRVAKLHISNQTESKTIFKHDLIDLLVKLQSQNTEVDWVNINDYEIIITFNTDLEITITINGWNVIAGEIELP